ncbi:cytochrome P450 2J2 [Pogona vitticeps]
MRKMGIGKKSMESQINEEVQQLLETFQQTNGKPLDPLPPISMAMSNVICSVTLGHRFPTQDKIFQRNMDAMNYIGKYGMSLFAFLYEMFPSLMNRLPGPHKTACVHINWVLSFLRTEVERHKKNPMQDEPQDIIDYYLFQMERRKRDPISTFSDNNLTVCIMDFFVAGTETTAMTLLWALLFMVCYPDVQEKVYKEIEEVLGSCPLICYEDQKNLPYTAAVIHEIIRVRYILIFGLPRQSAKDVVFRGFHIPKGTIVIADLQSVLLDPNQWETPHEFNPNHFLDKDGNFMAREEFLPFGAGSRVCLGEALAKMELFLFFTHLLRAFQFKLPDGAKKPSIEPRFGFVLRPHPYKICAIPRNNSS